MAFYRPTLALTEILVHSWVAFSRLSDRGDSAKRCEQKKTTTTRGLSRGEGVPLPLFLLIFLALFLYAALHYPNRNRLTAGAHWEQGP